MAIARDGHAEYAQALRETVSGVVNGMAIQS